MESHCKIFHCEIWFFFIPLWFILCMLLFGCKASDGTSEVKVNYVLKSGSIIISPDEFGGELELKKAAYPYDINLKTDEYNELVFNLVNQLSEEIVLREAAVEDGISVSEKEVTEAEKAFKKDFPGNSFQKMLLENAVPYSLWKKRFKIKLLMNRVIEKELKEKIEITSEEIAAYYKLQKKSGKFEKQKNDGLRRTGIDGKELVTMLRIKKAEEEYPAWIENLTRKFPVKINRKELSKFLKKIPLKENSQFKRNNRK